MAKLRTRAAGIGADVIDIPEGLEPLPRAAANPIGAEAISKRAYELWLERGSPEGSPEEDWYKAESELKDNAGEDNEARAVPAA